MLQVVVVSVVGNGVAADSHLLSDVFRQEVFVPERSLPFFVVLYLLQREVDHDTEGNDGGCHCDELVVKRQGLRTCEEGVCVEMNVLRTELTCEGTRVRKSNTGCLELMIVQDVYADRKRHIDRSGLYALMSCFSGLNNEAVLYLLSTTLLFVIVRLST